MAEKDLLQALLDSLTENTRKRKEEKRRTEDMTDPEDLPDGGRQL